MSFENPFEQIIPPTEETEAVNEVERDRLELELFNERIGEFTEADLDLDFPGGPDNATNYTQFDAKIRRVFPEISEERFSAMKAAVTMHLCGF